MKHQKEKTSVNNKTRKLFIAFLSVFIAVALGLTCALCFTGGAPQSSVDNVDTVEVDSSATYGNLTGDYSGVNKLATGDIINYSYAANNSYSIKLPKGTYTFEVWGAQGGGGYANGTFAAGTGLGGYAKGTVTLTAANTFYIVVGGKGTDGLIKKYGASSVAAGGYNGGGNSGRETNNDANDEAGGGGGATHIALAAGLLKNLSGSKNNIVIVAGGGGGTAFNRVAGKGHGGGTTGGPGYGSTVVAGGGTQTAGGTRGTSTGSGAAGVSTVGGFGYGGVGDNGYGSGGGGGGGWYGGGGGGASGGGGGGSGYIGGVSGVTPAVPLTNPSMTTGSRSGDGYARITVVKLNDVPVTASANGTTPIAVSGTTSNYYRGTSRNLTINASTIARDPDPVNTSAGTGGTANVYFTNNTASNLDTVPAANNGLWLNAACTTSASTYLGDWSWSASTLTINTIKRYPKAGEPGCSSDGVLTLYTRVRDNYYSYTQRGVAVIPFTLKINDYAIASKSYATTQRFAYTGYEYRMRNTPSLTNSNLSIANARLRDFTASANTNDVYNPANSGKTVFISTPLTSSTPAGFTVYASDLYSDSDSNTSYGDLVGIKGVTLISGYSGYVTPTNYYSITYNTTSAYNSGLSQSITIKPTNVRPNGPVFVCLTLTAQSCDRQGKTLTGSENKDVTLVFQIANTRPYYATTTGMGTSLSGEPLVTLNANGSGYVDISALVFDNDERNNNRALAATFARGSTDVKIPTNEYIQVNRGNSVIALASSSNYAAYNTSSQVAANSYTTGEGKTATNFSKDLVAMSGSAAAANASVVYSYDSATRIRFTARAATHYQYSGANRKGHFYILVRIVDPYDTADTGLWFPIAIQVNSAAPVELSPVANFTIGFNTFTPPSETSIDAQQGSDSNEGIVLTPISYTDGSGVVRGIGTTDKSFNGGGATHARPFVRDPDTIMYTGNSVVQTNPLSDLVVLNGATAETVLTMYEASSFFKVELIPLYAARSVFGRLNMTYDQLSALGIKSFTGDGSESGYTFYGLKITPLRSTDNRYFQFDVKVKDTHSSTKTVRVYVNVQNRAVQLRNGPSATSNYKINTMAGVGKYGYNSSLGMSLVNYSIEKDDVIQITPYDLAYDFDVDPSSINALNKGTMNTNPKDGAAFDSAAKNVILKTYSVYSVTSAGATTSTKTNQIGQQLVFANVDNFKASASQYASYISVDVKNTTVMNGNSYNIPCIEITGNSRTTTAVVQLRFTISDGYTSVDAVVTVTVNNSAPVLNDEAHNPTKYQMKPYYTMTADTTNRYNSYMFTATEMLYDKDNDSPSFVSGSVRIVAYDENGDDKDKLDEDGNKIEYYPYLYYNTTANTYRGTNDANKAEYNLSDYIYSALTKNESGADVVYVKGLSSTQLFDKKIYVEVVAQDGFRTQPKTGVIHVLLDVTNSAPKMVTDGLTETTENEYSWLITYDDISEVKMSRYIFSDKELAQSQPISDSNKIWLFDDYDAQQSAIFYPSEWKKTETDANWGKNLIYQTTSDITASSFTTSGQGGYNAAIIYKPTYPTAGTDNYLTLVLHFYKKSESGEFIEDKSIVNNENAIKTARYWALEIIDPVGETSAKPTQIAIAIKDDHFGNKVYTSADKSTYNANGTATSLRVLNFYYQYAKPGVMAMHTYYRTDGNSEAKTKLNDNNEYVLDIRGLPEYSNRGYLFANSNNPPQTQTELQSATFADDFKYQYFVKRVTDGSGAVIKTTYKHYPTTSNLAFHYRPIEVSTDALNGGSATVPMSYIAMPQSISGGTDGENYHVTFANARLTPAADYLYDSEYWNWSNDLVLQNVTLSDGVNSWTGATQLALNPYVDISYTYADNRKYLDTKYRNTKMGTLEMPSEGSEKYNFKLYEESELLDGSGASIYREDKYGFQISKKVSSTSHRSTGLLKLTIAVKTIAQGQPDDSAIEYVDVEINLKNSKPSGTVFQSGYINNLAVSMTTADASGKTVSLVKSGEKETGDYNIVYTDPDTTDTMKFLLASAMDNKNGNVMSKAYIDHAKNTNFNPGTAGGTATDIYFGDVTGDSRYTYTPNPGYEEFFSVSPSEGAASTLQFIPKAKTQVNLTGAELQKYMEDHNLEKDNDGNIYYPFRILFYDEISGSPFTDGYWVSAIIKVYIGNDIISAVKSDIVSEYKTTDSRYTKYNGSAMFSFKLSKSVDYFVDVTSLLVDNDIRIGENGSYVTKESGITDEIDGEQVVSVTEDYLKMPDIYGDDIIKRPGSASAELPVDITIGGDNVSDSTMVFSAKCAFKSSIVIAYTFKDSGGSSVVIIFLIEYNDEAPTANKDTYSAGAINITMKTGDSFTLYAADSTLFANDALGGYYSTGWLNNVKFPYGGEQEMTAAAMYKDFFGEDTAREPGSGNLGSLIVGSDDVASTLRFLNYTGNSVFKTAGDENCFEITAGTLYLREDQPTAQANRRPMAVTVKAIGVVSTTYTVTLMDGGGEDGKYKTVTVSVNITVISSPPTAQTNSSKLPSGLTKVDGKDNTYALSLKYGEDPVKFYLKDFMVDDDEKDEEGFTVYTSTDGTRFNIVNPVGVSAVSASTDTYLNNERIVLSATDYIDKAGEDGIVTVSFRVADAHGTVSELITFEITVLPSTVATVATQANPNSITLKSFAEYVRNGETVSVNLVEAGANAKMFRDADAAAHSSKYNVTVYALLNKNENGTFQTVGLAQMNRNNSKLLSLVGGEREDIDPDNEIVSYVSRFFTIDISDDGKKLYFTPNSATIASSGIKLEDIRLYVELSKRYNNGDKTALDVNNGYLYVSVANSALVAVENSALNSGYPTTAEGFMREEEFLTFTGTAGDSLTWDLYNTLDPELGLFYDYDMINNPAIMSSGVNIGGRETIKYIRSEYSVIEHGISGKGDVLSVSVVDGKLTIKINRKVYIGGIPPYKEDKKSTTIDVKIYCADTLGDRSSPKAEVFTTIKVVVENDLPEIKTVTKQSDIDKLGYSITTYSSNSVDRYVLNSKLEKGKSLAVNIRDIIEDADIDMDAYALLCTGSEMSLMSSDGRTLNNDGKITSGASTLLTVNLIERENSYNTTTLSQIVFTCVSAERGAVAKCELMFRDSIETTKTSILEVNITIDNIAPEAKQDVNMAITVMGVRYFDSETKDSAEALAETKKAAVTRNILDFVSDQNGDDYDANDAANKDRRPTYVFIDEITVYTLEDIVNRPTIYGAGVVSDITDMNYTSTVCGIGWDDADSKHQTFTITPVPGVYGKQVVTFTVIDSGYEDGDAEGILDGKAYSITITITVANPLTDLDDVLEAAEIAYGVTRTFTAVDLLGEQNAQGYTIAAIEETGSNSFTVYKPGEAQSVMTSATAAPSTENWRVYARTEGARSNFNVVFKAGEVEVQKTLPIWAITNTAPTEINGKTTYEYTKSRLTKTNSGSYIIKIYPEEWFGDTDTDDIMSFVGPIESSQKVKVEAMLDYDDDGRSFILLTFNRRGEADISFNVTDLSGKLYNKKITVNCTDADEMSWWENFVSLIEANWLWFWIILACILLFIIFLIILIVVVCKKRRMRREIEALLNSETELEEEMMRLSAGVGMNPYQSFGYLPPTQQAFNPNLMLGGGATAPVPNSLQLNAGVGAPPVGTQTQIPPAQSTGAPVSSAPNTGAQVPPQQTASAPVTPQQPQQQMQQPRPQQQAQAPITPPPPPASSDGFDPNDF